LVVDEVLLASVWLGLPSPIFLLKVRLGSSSTTEVVDPEGVNGSSVSKVAQIRNQDLRAALFSLVITFHMR
jgi:hypothetical protein